MILRINLATKVYFNARRLKLYSAAAVALLTALVFFNVWDIAAKADEMKRLTNEVAAMDDKFKTASKGVPEKEYRALLDRIDFANNIIDRKTYNWLELLDQLEMVVPDGIAISSIVPDPKSQGLKLAGVSRSFGNLRIFMEHLEESKFFTDVYLTSQGDAKLGDNPQGITFNLTCKVTKK